MIAPFSGPFTRCGSGVAIALALLISASPQQAHADGPFAAMAGTWSGAGSITVSGNRERIRCRANYSVSNAGATVDLQIRCAGDSYKFDLQAGVNATGTAVSGTWSESVYGAAGTISGTATAGSIRVNATGPYLSANMSMTTRGNTQSISLTSPGSQISAVSISLSKSR